MPGFFGFAGAHKALQLKQLLDTLDPLARCEAELLRTPDFVAASVALRENNLLSARTYEDQEFVGVLAGDLVDCEVVPWRAILDAHASNDYSCLNELRGVFSIVAFSKARRELILISDLFALHPVYYSISKNATCVSTGLSVYCRLPNTPSFNVAWLYELLYFNYPIAQTTFLENVYRMPAATILTVDVTTGIFSLTAYGKKPTRTRALLKGAAGLERAYEVFRKTVPKYYGNKSEIALSLTSGFDSRTVLAFLPEQQRKRVQGYTYGLAGCDDLLIGKRIAEREGLRHLGVQLGEEFNKDLPALMERTVFLSAGTQEMSRSALPFVYSGVAEQFDNCPIFLTGVSGDHLFRDHIRTIGNTPTIISGAVTQYVQQHQYAQQHRGFVMDEIFSGLFKGQISKAYEHIAAVIDEVRDRLGALNTPEGYLGYLIYEVAPKYFGGEAAIANHYGVFRTPFWDIDIVGLPYEIEYGTIGFSERFPSKKDRFAESKLQAFLISKQNGRLSDIYIRGVPLQVFQQSNKRQYYTQKLLSSSVQRISNFLFGRQRIGTENWGKWMEGVLAPMIEELLQESALVFNYVDFNMVRTLRRNKQHHWVRKILTAELVLRLMQNGWKTNRE